MSTWTPKRIIQIVSGSRSGSTLLKSLLAQSPSVCSLDGEEEPYIRFAGNGYNLTTDSDEIHKLINKELIRSMIYEELTTPRPWEHRLKLQYSGTQLYRLLERLNTRIIRADIWLSDSGILGHYDIAPKSLREPFDGNIVAEMRPYIVPRFDRGEIKDTLLLKCPYNVYRPNILKDLYPKAEISRVLLVRNPAAIINGLYDGWCANYGFHKHLTPSGWWKFDLPPNWNTVATMTTMEKSYYQFKSSYMWIHSAKKDGDILCNFESVIENTEPTIGRLCSLLDIDPPRTIKLEEKMSTVSTDINRWKSRASRILPLLSHNGSTEALIDWMGYNLENLKCR